MTEEVTAQRTTLSQAVDSKRKAETGLAEMREESTAHISHLVDSLEQKSKAGALSGVVLERERECVCVCVCVCV